MVTPPRESDARRPAAMALLAILALGGTVGCDPTTPPESPSTADVREPRSTTPPDPRIDAPGFDQLEPSVRKQLLDASESLDQRLTSTSDAVERGRAFGATGQVYHAYALHDMARELYALAADHDPNEPKWTYYLAQLDRYQGELDRAFAGLQEFLDARPDYVAAHVALAEVAIERGADGAEQRATTHFERALALDDRCARAMVGLGRVALSAKQYDRALELFRRALTLAPGASRVHFFIGMAHRGRGERDLAEASLNKRGAVQPPLNDPLMDEVKRHAGGARLHVKRGADYFTEGMYSEAKEQFELAVAADPNDARAHGNLGSALKVLDDLPGARREFERAVALDPEYALAHFNLGTLWSALGQHQEAIRCYRRAIEIEPGATASHFNLANALFRIGDLEAAQRHYDAVLAATPSDGAARFSWLLCAIRRGDFAAAVARARHDVTVLPEDLRVRQVYVRLLATAPDAELRDAAEAVRLGKQLVEDAASVEHVEAYAMALAEAGRFDLATQWQKKALEAVERANRTDLQRSLARNLARYERGEPCRRPWEPDSRTLNPNANPPQPQRPERP